MSISANESGRNWTVKNIDSSGTRFGHTSEPKIFKEIVPELTPDKSVLASSAVVLLLTSVLTPEPSDILNTDLSLPDFIESRECSRMTSALGLYYVVLRRDKLNKVSTIIKPLYAECQRDIRPDSGMKLASSR